MPGLKRNHKCTPKVEKKKVEPYTELKKLAKDPSHPCGKPYTVEVTIEGIAPLLMVRWNP